MNYRKKNRKRTNTWKLNNMLLKNQWVNSELKEEIRKYVETNENENTTFQNLRCSKSSSKRKVYSNTCLPQETRKISNKQPKLTPKAIKERIIKKPQS